MTEALEGRAYLSAGIAFQPVVHYSTDQYPAAIATARLSVNGFQDVVTANYGAGTVSVLAGNGDGTFQPAVNYPVGNGPDGLAVADVNGDGLPDIIVANSGTNPADTANTDFNTVSVLLNNDNGTFAAKQDYATGPNPTGVAVADMNGDHSPDLIITSSGGNSVRVLLNNGTGVFSTVGDYSTGLRPFAVAAADVNDDGLMDVVTANAAADKNSTTTDTVSVLFGNGDGTLQRRTEYPTGKFPRSVAIADINNDGKPDIVVACRQDSTVNLLLGHHNGTFSPSIPFSAGGGAFGIAVADLNANGQSDIIAADQAAISVSILRRTKNQGILPEINFHAGNGNEGVAVADFNEDGQPDLAVANFNDSTIGILLNTSASLSLTNTKVRLKPADSQIRVGDMASFTARVTSARGMPTGNVAFFDGDALIGTEPLLNGSASLAANLQVGIHSIRAYYAGNSTFAPRSSTLVSQLVTPTASGPDLVASFRSTTLPVSFVAGDVARVQFLLTNQGDSIARGSIANQLFLSTDGTIANAIPLVIHGSLSHFKGKIKPGKSMVLTAKFKIPANVAPGNYALVTQINVDHSLVESDVTNNLAASAIIFHND